MGLEAKDPEHWTIVMASEPANHLLKTHVRLLLNNLPVASYHTQNFTQTSDQSPRAMLWLWLLF